MVRPVLVLALFYTLSCFSQTLHEEIKQVYDFSPGKLSKEEQDKRIPLMDEFWSKVKSDTAKYLSELRTELQTNENPKFFYFEGGQLLLSVSRNIKDKEIVLNAILKSDLNDIDRRTYVATLNYLAKSNLNTTDHALKILNDKNFKFFIPEHAFSFNQGYCLTYSLLPTKPEYYLGPLKRRLNEEADISTKKSIVTCLWFANTCDGNEFLKNLVNDKSIEKEVSDYTIDLLNRKIKKEKYYKALDNMSYSDLVKAQIASTNRMSDEAIYELDYITKLMRKVSCRE